MGDKSTPMPSTAKKCSPKSMTGQQSILGFFKASAVSGPGSSPASIKRENAPICLQQTTKTNMMKPKKRTAASKMTSLPSSDAVEPLSSQENRDSSPIKIAAVNHAPLAGNSSHKKAVNYAESCSDDDEVVIASLHRNRKRRQRVLAMDDEEDDFTPGGEAAGADQNSFAVSDESEVPKRKRPATKSLARKRSHVWSPATAEQKDEDMAMEEGFTASTAQQWKYEADKMEPRPARSRAEGSAKTAPSPSRKPKAHTQEPEKRYTWLARVQDKDRKYRGEPDYDARTIHIPPQAWAGFSPFEKQYWQIKQDLFDTVVFFKKGKFYELYEQDATIGHQLFDLKMTDRVNMRMVGVPESSLDIWINQFVAKGYKVARVEQMESALGKEMRERGDTTTKAGGKKGVIRRELSCILTGGTLVEGSMLQDDMATYCAAIKETVVSSRRLDGDSSVPTDDERRAFGIALVDAATGQFFVSEFQDDAELTKFETFVAQVSPRELLLEKSRISAIALRILKNNTLPTTIWNHLKPGVEFWDADTARRELDCGGYFADGPWPEKLVEARGKDLAMSALGALVSYLKILKLDQSLLSQGNFAWYSPINCNGTLVLDGQSLVNLEVFANTANGGPEGTLFTLLNRCVTPFGKRLFRQWVCHPLCNIRKINERLDAVDMLNTESNIRDQFSSRMSKMPDLERLISRIHAGSCKPEDFLRVLEGFAQMEHTMGLLGSLREGGGLVGKLMASLPGLNKPLLYWETALDRKKTRDKKLLMPEGGIDEDFDNSEHDLQRIRRELDELLERQKMALKCGTVKFADLGHEVYQVEVPKSVQVPSSWRQMSATATVRRYYFRELETLVRELQEAEEVHSQIVKDVTTRFFRRFDADYDVWLQAIRIVAQLDCLVSLAKTSSALGQPSCRPQFVNEARSLLAFEELRHPCMLDTVADFIPNDVRLGGDEAKMHLLTGANAAGKSTILRMTCVAVIMAHMGCHVPAVSARLTPVDRIMSRLGANDNIMAAQSTFFVELSETKKILAEATPRTLIILDELGRGTSSYDGVAVAQAVLHHVATHIGCLGFFATHYHSLAAEFAHHAEVRAQRMQIHVDDEHRIITFLYKLESGVAEGSFGMHCAAMCGISNTIIERAAVAAREWEHTSRLQESLERAKTGCYMPLGVLSDVATLLRPRNGDEAEAARYVSGLDAMGLLLRAIERL